MFFFILLLILLINLGCNPLIIGNEPENTYINEYNPQKAGAEIIAQYNVSKGLSVNRQNDLFYMICENKILCFDISADEVQIQREINFDFTAISNDPILHVYGFADFGDNLIFLASCDKYGDDKIMLSVNAENGQISYSEDVSADIANAESMYYDDINDILYLSFENRYKDRRIVSFTKNDIGIFENGTEIRQHTIPVFLSGNGFCAYTYNQDSSWTLHEYVHIYKDYKTQNISMVELGYLRMRFFSSSNKLLSAFSDDDGNIWLYVREYNSETKQDKYELLKLKLLE